MSESRVYGIDLGTTYTCIARVEEISGKPAVVPNVEAELTTPSVVLFEDAETRVVGREAKNMAVLKADHVVEMIKRAMGTPSRLEFFGKEFSPEEISSYILRKVVDDAERSDEVRPHKVVITCPAYFSTDQRAATVNAGRIAGLEVLEIINEPTAAAIAYGSQDKGDETVLVYDLGGGTFDISLIRIAGGGITVVATAGNDQLGGRNWDEQIVRYCAARWADEHGGSTDDVVSSPETLQDLWIRAESHKRSLGALPKVRIPVVHEGKQSAVELTRADFDKLTAPLLENTITFTKQVMDIAREHGHPEVDRLLLVGGSTKMPQVAERLRQEFSFPVESFNPDVAVAQGAAIYGQKLLIGDKIKTKIAEMTRQNVEDVNLQDTPESVRADAEEDVASEMGLRLPAVRAIPKVTNVSSHSFGVLAFLKDDSEAIANLVFAQQPLPIEHKQIFGTKEGGTGIVEIKIFESTVTDEFVRDLGKGAEVGYAQLEMRPGLPAGSPIEVTFQLDAQGQLRITGEDKSDGGKIVEATLKTDRVLSVEEVEQAIERSRAIQVIG